MQVQINSRNFKQISLNCFKQNQLLWVSPYAHNTILLIYLFSFSYCKESRICEHVFAQKLYILDSSQLFDTPQLSRFSATLLCTIFHNLQRFSRKFAFFDAEGRMGSKMTELCK